ncbi:MAG: DUF4968 domain-containing protein [Bacteroidota bacterium]|nr:DUF4968 domain-containing protein [Bacteroidota bacterium]
MKRKSVIVALLGAILVIPVAAQNYQKTAQGIKTRLQSMDVEVQFYSPSIVRVLKAPEGFVYKKESLSVIKKPQDTRFTTTQQGDVVAMKSNKLEVDVNLKTGKVSYLDLQGNPLLTEKDYGTQFTPTVDVQKNTYTARQAFLLDKDEPIYGLGQQQNNRLNQRGQQNVLKNGNTRVCIPFFQSIKGYGIFWDNYASTLFTDNLQETSFESLADCSDYYFMYGGSGDGVVAQMRDLTGQVPMLPMWTYG